MKGFIKISMNKTIKIDDIKVIEKEDTGYTRDTEGWIIRIYTKSYNEYDYIEFKNREERNNVFDKLNAFFNAKTIDELLKDVRA